jgi:glutamyl-tRNA synthetase
MKETLAAHQVKMPQLAPAVRVLVCGRSQTPSIDAVLALFDRSTVLATLAGSSEKWFIVTGSLEQRG